VVYRGVCQPTAPAGYSASLNEAETRSDRIGSVRSSATQTIIRGKPAAPFGPDLDTDWMRLQDEIAVIRSKQQHYHGRSQRRAR
jgi:hypothetical protein